MQTSKSRLAVVLFFGAEILLSSNIVAAQTAGTYGFQGLPWGVQAVEIEKKFKGMLSTEKCGGGNVDIEKTIKILGLLCDRYVIKKYPVAGVDFSVRFTQLASGELSGVSLESYNEDEKHKAVVQDSKKTFAMFRSLMEERYGAPEITDEHHIKDKNSSSYSGAWRKGDTVTKLRVHNWVDRGVGIQVITVDYEPSISAEGRKL